MSEDLGLDVHSGEPNGEPLSDFHEHKIGIRNSMEGASNPYYDGPLPGDGYHLTPQDVSEKNLFGTWDGVYARCLLNILGVIMYVRLGWMVGQAGVLLALVIIFLCSAVTFITSLSLSAICTNGEVRGGGAYYLISRSLGPEFGGAIGVLFTFASSVATALHIIGFAESIKTVLVEDHGFELTPGGDWDIRVYGLITLVALLFISVIGVEYVTKFGLVLLFLLVISIISIIFGAFYCCVDNDKDVGFTGWGNFADNLGPQWTDGESFFSVVAVFFPAVTGIMAGANISGDLKDPQKSLPLGTILSVITTSGIYVVLVLILGAVCVRVLPEGQTTSADSYGLIDNYLIMNNISLWEPLVLIGLIAAALSSALSCLNGAPRILQAVAKDKILPGIHFFALGRGPNAEPDRGSILATIIAAAGILIGDLNVIAMYITNFYLISYAFINYACFSASESQVPGWRPSFMYYNKWVALLGTVGCLCGMFLIDYISALITVAVFLTIYKYLDFHEPEVNWGGSSQAKIYKSTLHNLVRLEKTGYHVKTFRPQFLAFLKNRQTHLNSILFITKLSGRGGLTVCARVSVPLSTSSTDISPHPSSSNNSSNENRNSNQPNENIEDPIPVTNINEQFLDQGQKPISSIPLLENMNRGADLRKPSLGLVRVRPSLNVGVEQSNAQSPDLEVGLGIGVLGDGSDEYERLINDESNSFGFEDYQIFNSKILASDYRDGCRSLIQCAGIGRLRPNVIVFIFPFNWNSKNARRNKFLEEYIEVLRDTIDYGLSLCVLRGLDSVAPDVRYEGYTDIYWLAEDGGLTILLPHLLRSTTQWKKSKLRFFIPGRTLGESEEHIKRLTVILKKFRIPFKLLSVVEGLDQPASPSLIEEYQHYNIPNELEHPKTNFFLKLAESISTKSLTANLVFVTLPLPEKSIPAQIYLSWLDFLAKDVKRIVYLRGNNEIILTHLS